MDSELSEQEQDWILSDCVSEELDLFVEVERKVQRIEPEWLRNLIMKDLRASPLWLVAGMQSKALYFEDKVGDVSHGMSPYIDDSATAADYMLIRAENDILKKVFLNM